MFVFGFAVVVAVALFATSGRQGGKQAAAVTMWGTFPRAELIDYFTVLNESLDKQNLRLDYIEQPEDEYSANLVEAFASGSGPDLFFINQDMILSFENKIFPIPYESFPTRDFTSRYTDGSSIFLSPEGVLAFPFAVDPYVMYYNKTMLNNAGIAKHPTTWTQFNALADILTQRSEDGTSIIKSAFAFGQFANINNADRIFHMLLLQLGNTIISRSNDGTYISVVNQSNNTATRPFNLAMQFFTNFSNPLNDSYTWNSALPTSLDMFVQDRLAIFFAPASQFFDIQRRNINLNYDIAPMPQIAGASAFVTYGDFYGIATSKASKNPQAALNVAAVLANGGSTQDFLDKVLLAPLRRDLLSVSSLDPYQSAIRDSALISYTWLNPNRGIVYSFFKDAVDGVVRGSTTEGVAASVLEGELSILLERFNN